MKKFLIIFGIIAAVVLIAAFKSHNGLMILIAAILVFAWTMLWKWWRHRDEKVFKTIANSLNFKPEHIEGCTASYYFDGHRYNLLLKNNRLILLTEAKLRNGSENQNFTDTNNEMKALQKILAPSYSNISTSGELSNDGKRAAFAVLIPVNDENVKGLDDIMNRFTQIIGAYTESEAISQTAD